MAVLRDITMQHVEVLMAEGGGWHPYDLLTADLEEVKALMVSRVWGWCRVEASMQRSSC